MGSWSCIYIYGKLLWEASIWEASIHGDLWEASHVSPCIYFPNISDQAARKKRLRPLFSQACRCDGSPLTLRLTRADRSGIEASLPMRRLSSLNSRDCSPAHPERPSTEAGDLRPSSVRVCSPVHPEFRVYSSLPTANRLSWPYKPCLASSEPSAP